MRVEPNGFQVHLLNHSDTAADGDMRLNVGAILLRREHDKQQPFAWKLPADMQNAIDRSIGFFTVFLDRVEMKRLHVDKKKQ